MQEIETEGEIRDRVFRGGVGEYIMGGENNSTLTLIKYVFKYNFRCIAHDIKT